MINFKYASFALAGILVASLSGCVSMWSDDIRHIYQSELSVGQEFLDLQKAKDSGAISESEYIELKKLLVEKYKSLLDRATEGDEISPVNVRF